MAYKSHSWRDSRGEPRDPFGDTHPNIVALAREMKNARETGEVPNLSHVLEKITDSLVNLSAKTQIDHKELQGEVNRLRDRTTLLLWASGVIFVAIVGGLVAALFKAMRL